jgi:hypothetical protein
VVLRLVCHDRRFGVVAGNVISITIHYLKSVLPGFRRVHSNLGVG